MNSALVSHTSLPRPRQFQFHETTSARTNSQQSERSPAKRPMHRQPAPRPSAVCRDPYRVNPGVITRVGERFRRLLVATVRRWGRSTCRPVGVARGLTRVFGEEPERTRDCLGELLQTLGQVCATGGAASAEQSAGPVQRLGELLASIGRTPGRRWRLNRSGRSVVEETIKVGSADADPTADADRGEAALVDPLSELPGYANGSPSGRGVGSRSEFPSSDNQSASRNASSLSVGV
jgi:hypothetical protein